MKILPVIVLYKQLLTHCASLNTLLKDYKGEIFVFDNSPQSQEIPENLKTIYFHAPENPGISYAYNRGAEYAADNGYTHILLLDQDTIFHGSIQAYYEAIEKFPDSKLYAPIMKTTKGVPFSPANMTRLWIRGISLAPGEYNLDKYSPLNSGLMIELQLFQKVGGYNEKVFLDFADFAFIERVSAVNKYFCLMDLYAEQNFSNDETDCNKLLTRHKLYILSVRNCKWRSISKKIQMLFNIVKRTIKIYLRTYKIDALKIFLKFYILGREEQ